MVHVEAQKVLVDVVGTFMCVWCLVLWEMYTFPTKYSPTLVVRFFTLSHNSMPQKLKINFLIYVTNIYVHNGVHISLEC